MDGLTSLLGRNGFLPHGWCFQWSPGLLWSMVTADALIAASYFSIPLALLSYLRRRGSAPRDLGAMPWLFSAFIFACGVTHLIDILVIWRPDYGLQAAGKVITAGISAVTALALWPLIPRALRIPSVDQLRSAVASLEAEVSRRRSAEEHLADTERSLAITLASIDAGFVATDREGRVTRMNAVAERVSGWPQAEALGVDVREVLWRADRPPELQRGNPVDLLAERGVTSDTVHDLVVRGRGGRHARLELRCERTLADDGTPRGMVVVFRDVTLLREAETGLQRLAAIVESSEDAIVSKTLDGIVASWNRGAETMFGWRAEEIVGRPVQLLFPPGTEHDEMALLARLARGERIPPFDAVRHAKDGRALQVSVAISPVRDAQGRIVGASKIVRDMSVQRRAEAALRESEARLRLALDTAEIGEWEIDAADETLRGSPRFARCFGHAELPAGWTLAALARQLHDDDRAVLLASLRAALAAGRDWQAEVRVRWPDGSEHWLDLRGSAVDAGSGALRWLGVATDITRHRLAEQAHFNALRLEAENRQIQEASRLKSQFLANMSHELRTPLNAVIGFADLLRMGAVPADSPKHGEYLGHIATSGRHLLQLINDVLDLSKVEAGKLEFVAEPVRLPALVGEVGSVMQGLLQAKQQALAVELDPALDDLVLDPSRLKQVLYNLLSNAVKFTGEGGHIAVRARPQGARHFVLEVEDDGVGIAESDQARLFVAFQQLDAGYAKRHQGTGLGLALTRRLVQAQGGEVEVHSRLGQGSVFRVLLPRRPAELPAGPRLLVVGEAGNAARLAGPLGESGFVVDVATSADAARRHAGDRRYDALTLELLLPDQPGLQLLGELRREGASRAAPVLGLSLALSEEHHAAFALADVLAKPLHTDEVLRALATAGLGSGSGARVMVVDDDPRALELMQATLGSAGLVARGWTDGRLALHEIDAWQPAALVLDLMMPGFDGFELLAELSRRPAWRATPVFLWTSLLLTDAEYALLRRSARAVLHKGDGTLEQLIERLRTRRAARGVVQ